MKNYLNCWEVLKPVCLYGAKAETSYRMAYDDSKSKCLVMDNQQLSNRKFNDYPVRE